MTTSEVICDIATALAKAQGEMGGAMKDSANPFFKSKYADLSSVWEACRAPLAKNGIAVIQSPTVADLRVSLDTLLVHTSGQWIRNVLSCTIKEDTPQVIGSATTYLRRYALQSLVGVAPEDDDAEIAQGRGNGHARSTPVQETLAPKGFEGWLLDMEAAVPEGTTALERAWKASSREYREHLTKTQPKTWEAMKKKAADFTTLQTELV